MKRHAGIVVVCAVFFVLGILRLNDLSLYTPDSCRYVIIGNSLAHGMGIVDATSPDPQRSMIQAPLYAFLLAPVEFFFPLSLIAVKLWTLIWGGVCIVAFYLFLQSTLGRTAALIGALMLACNPVMVIFSTEALSDAPFVAVLLIIIFLSERVLLENGEDRRALIAIVLCASILPLFREVGIAAIVAVGIYFLYRRMRLYTIAVVVVSASLLGLWYLRNTFWAGEGSHTINPGIFTERYVTPPGSPFINEIALRMWYSVKAYLSQFGEMLFDPFSSTQLSELVVEPSPVYRSLRFILGLSGWFIVLATISSVLFGIFSDIRFSRSASLRTAFFVVYWVIILAFPAHDIRYLYPILPLAIYYCLRTAQRVFLRRKIAVQFALGAALVSMLPNLCGMAEITALNLEYIRTPENVLRHPSVPAMYRYQWKKLAGSMQDQLPEDLVIGSPVKDLALFAGTRKVLEIDPSVSAVTFDNLLRDYHVEYLLAPRRWNDLRYYEFLMTESRRFWFEPAGGLPNLIRVHSRFLEPGHGSALHGAFDTLSASGLLRKGRMELVRGMYQQAGRTLDRSLRSAPAEPEVLFQSMVAQLMNGDTISARALYRQFLSLPQTVSYIDQSLNHWNAVSSIAKSRAAAMPEERAINSFQAAMIYWKIGYPGRAREIMNELLASDSSYFVGTLWGFHFNMQMGDTSRALTCLSRLERMDSSNNVVKSFRKIVVAIDSLRLARTPAARSRLYLNAASAYRQVDLSDEAIDEAEKALEEQPGNSDVLLFLAHMFETRNHLHRAEQYYLDILRYDPHNRSAASKLEILRQQL